jgi:hypothetical protein
MEIGEKTTNEFGTFEIVADSISYPEDESACKECVAFEDYELCYALPSDCTCNDIHFKKTEDTK